MKARKGQSQNLSEEESSAKLITAVETSGKLSKWRKLWQKNLNKLSLPNEKMQLSATTK